MMAVPDKSRPRRSALYLPASNARAIAKARTLTCDVVILDLEDAVAPEAKVMAREQAVAAVQEGGFGERELVVRINSLASEWGEADLAALSSVVPNAILVPKIDSAAALMHYAAALAGTPVHLWAMIETARSIFRLDEIAASSADGPLTALVMGTNDLAKEMGAELDTAREPFLAMLGLVVAAARAHRLVVLDGVFNDIEDSVGLAGQLQQARKFGFDGKTLIHPSQVAACNAAFTPDGDAVTRARAVVAAFVAPENAAKGVIRLDGRMVERLHLDAAWRILAAAGRDYV